ncbi:TadA family conjugal transfer-associated ATPase [Knoellia subterranea]|uniref:Type II secretion system protein E n=1 Tax=Knoellia subterranea KCTC 19937 TaxID=1385521 RepID=A0A0A0JLV2_9MICO|nr:TadA family conjugal transfer-associated ATPase [Knoellia subterranea]KGN38098.1 type II secretion system protein E [Knoellia subterranea KCTC 19937]
MSAIPGALPGGLPGSISGAAPWPGVEEAIRAGRAPDPELIGEVTGSVLELGSVGAVSEGARLREQVLGFGPLEPWIADESVTDVLVNGDGSVWVDRGLGIEDVGLRLEAAAARGLAVRLAGLARRRLDESQPWVDGVLPGGVRLHAILPPLAEVGTHLSLRIPRHQPAGVDGLVQLGAAGVEMARVLRGVVASRLSFVVVGGTGAGKTTVLGALLSECGSDERLVVVEDVRELAPAHPHVVRLQGRMPNVEGIGAVSMVDLVRQALRMRPDRLVVGEVRGAEVRELLSALNTGHDGGAGTVHANGLHEVPARFEALGALAGLGREAVHAQLRGAVQVIVEVARSGGIRFVRAVGVARWTGSEVVVDEAVSVTFDEPARAVTTGARSEGLQFTVRTGPGAAALEELLRDREPGRSAVSISPGAAA